MRPSPKVVSLDESPSASKKCPANSKATVKSCIAVASPRYSEQAPLYTINSWGRKMTGKPSCIGAGQDCSNMLSLTCAWRQSLLNISERIPTASLARASGTIPVGQARSALPSSSSAPVRWPTFSWASALLKANLAVLGSRNFRALPKALKASARRPYCKQRSPSTSCKSARSGAKASAAATSSKAASTSPISDKHHARITRASA
mmetsp:Transcript_67779/g.148766  ORF Transcript_67779/g.148766 Transcript_67779/m.148766 type:complete len:205 (-) Transcript_67779:2195-2809(-)